MKVQRYLIPVLALWAANCSKPASERTSDSPGAVSSALSALPLASSAPSLPSTRGSGPTASASAVPPSPSTACPANMVEIKGEYCTAVMFRCIRGGENHRHEKTDYPDPFYCDEYQKGYAPCLGKKKPKHFCMDEYEYPNREGAIPRVMVSWYESKRLCEAQGKRLCGDDEWTLACEGPARWPYTYGWKRDAKACNIDRLWIDPDDGMLASKDPAKVAAEVERLSARVPSGSMPGCVSPYGVKDMGGNVDEWAENVTHDGKPFKSVFKGGHWVKGARNRCRPGTGTHDETTAYYAEGFRCCADVGADGG